MSQSKQNKMRRCHNCGKRMWGTASDLINHGIWCTSTSLKNLMPSSRIDINKRGVNWKLIIGLPTVIIAIIVIIYLLEK
jgi:hypothetical protein